MRSLDIVQPQGTRQRLDDVVGDGLLPALLETAVMIGAQPGEDC